MRNNPNPIAEKGTRTQMLYAFALPMIVFLLLLILKSSLPLLGSAFWLSFPEYWLYPAQTILCGILLMRFWKFYRFRPLRNLPFTVAVAILVFLLWISPQAFLHFAPRVDGFNPDIFAGNYSAYWLTIVFRFLRLAVVVPFVEEIFWRGFLLRYLIDENFAAVPFGKFSWVSFVVVTAAFGFAHSSADRIAALITGAIYNGIAYRTKSLGSCVLAHAITNLALGLWIMWTKQWGFW